MYAFSKAPLALCPLVEAYARIEREYLVTGEGVIATPGPYEGRMWWAVWAHACARAGETPRVLITRSEARAMGLPMTRGEYPRALEVVEGEDGTVDVVLGPSAPEAEGRVVCAWLDCKTGEACCSSVHPFSVGPLDAEENEHGLFTLSVGLRLDRVIEGLEADGYTVRWGVT